MQSRVFIEQRILLSMTILVAIIIDGISQSQIYLIILVVIRSQISLHMKRVGSSVIIDDTIPYHGISLAGHGSVWNIGIGREFLANDS